MSEFKLTSRQEEAHAILASAATHGMLFGGSRSGKTFLHVRNTILRAMKARRSRHAILRYRFNHIKASIILDTFPKVMDLCFPGVEYTLNKTDWFVTLPNESEVWFGGLDDKERTEKILGQEYATIYFNECSQIPFNSQAIAITRLAQKAEIAPNEYLTPRAFYDMNPTDKIHWTYRTFIQKVDPETKKPLPDPEKYVSFQINPEDNLENLSSTYIDTLRSLSPRLQKRFLRGEFTDGTPNALFNDQLIETWRVLNGDIPDLVRVVVSVDPSGSGDDAGSESDAIGIMVTGLGTDGNAYVLEDLTVKAGPATWGRVVVDAYIRHEADICVGEGNYGGAMVSYVVRAAANARHARVAYKQVTATRGKVVRAEPVSALYEQGKVRHVGFLRELEEELSGFTTNGYTGDRSPNRADALIWGITELFPAIVSPLKPGQSSSIIILPTVNHWR
jgi:PBSX family phage terminase large subunit